MLDDTFSLTNIDNGNQIHSGEMNVIGLQTHRDNLIPKEKNFFSISKKALPKIILSASLQDP